MQDIDLVNVAEIIIRLNAPPTTVRSWFTRCLLPKPERFIGGKPFWLWQSILDCDIVQAYQKRE